MSTSATDQAATMGNDRADIRVPLNLHWAGACGEGGNAAPAQCRDAHPGQDGGRACLDGHASRTVHAAAAAGKTAPICARALAIPFSAASALILNPSIWMKWTLVRPMKPRIVRRYGSWKSNAVIGPSLYTPPRPVTTTTFLFLRSPSGLPSS